MATMDDYVSSQVMWDSHITIVTFERVNKNSLIIIIIINNNNNNESISSKKKTSYITIIRKIKNSDKNIYIYI